MMKKIISVVFALLLCVSLSVTAFAQGDAPRLFDSADLITDSEESSLQSRIDEVSEKYKVEIVIATFDSVGEYTVDEYVEAYYDDNNFGYGENKDGVLLLVSMEERDYRILSNGFGATAISMDDIDYIGDNVAYYLSDGYYADAFNAFIDDCEYEINGEINGFPFEFGANLLISLVVGFVIALIATGIMRGKLKSVKKQTNASVYTKPGSMQITNATELFLYRTVNRYKIEKSSSGSSGGSSGSSRNVGGGKF